MRRKEQDYFLEERGKGLGHSALNAAFASLTVDGLRTLNLKVGTCRKPSKVKMCSPILLAVSLSPAVGYFKHDIGALILKNAWPLKGKQNVFFKSQ